MQCAFPTIATLLISVLLFPLPGLCAENPAGASTDILIRTQVDPKNGIVLGQQVILEVDVLAADGWAQIKGVGDFTVEGTQVVRYESQGIRLNETFQGRAYTGQRYQLSLFPRRDGTVTVPSIPVEVEVSRWGGQAGKTTENLKTPSVSFKVAIPPGAQGISGLVSTPGLTATQSWDPDAQSFKVGEAIKRTIALSGRDISGMAFTPLTFNAPDQVSVYPAEPGVDDKYDRGTLTGKRIETVTYVFTGPGTVALPEITIPWWDTDGQEMRQAVLPALKLDIAYSAMAATDETGGAATEASTGMMSRWLIAAATGLMLIAALFYLFRNRIRNWWKKRRQARHEAERFYFKQFTKAAESNDPKAVYNSVMRWLDRIHTGAGAARLDEFLRRYGGEKSLAETDRLLKALSMAQAEWSGAALIGAMRTARRNWKTVQRKNMDDMGLPALNP